MGAILINRSWPFVQIFIPHLSKGSTWNVKKIVPGVSEEKLCKGVDGWRTDDRLQLITVAHPEPLAQVP